MSAPDHKADTASNTAAERRPHARPVRLSREAKLPLAVRKELLLTRAALERYDFSQAVSQVRGSTGRLARLRHWLPGTGNAPTVLKVLGVARDHPLLSSAVSLALPLLRKTPLARWAWNLSKVGMLAGAGYLAYQRWSEGQQGNADGSPAPETPADAPAPGRQP
ncbi:hypothetical protein BKK79_16290 [Cupriavidus sp. USMAA2-4]|uniref:DUF3318 domain-containing protein n=1 Tax=Cupriavidus malaysiensis TaxID=367825 RepID=A0ABM6F6W6_9BURK|nr:MULTISPECIES: DUF3318 domain-containing protein [Cupriavidus]AOY93184.1 hypothetical protein BKK79_16290 [Cupriavidus sp. USMAA2-4]AOZ00525.1 hypothetical protein BKK81_15710 [Cupriavidus sp. USMAHM13]AOZ07272.1 hypothetical protein BKK80_16665 [Cupriavidus malaysiensis]